MNRYECDSCGLTGWDLPDGIDPEVIFERDGDDPMLCQGCQQIPANQRQSAWVSGW